MIDKNIEEDTKLSSVFLASISAILFAHGESISLKKLAELLDSDEDSVKAGITTVQSILLNQDKLGICIRQVEDEYFMTTKADSYIKDNLKKLFSPEFRSDLSNASYEVLATIAYNQPVTRAQIETVRGVNSDYSITKLLERGLIEVVGQSDVIGRPSLFATTKLFLQQVGLNSLSELPAIDLLMYDIVKDLESKGK